ncbi:MAG: phage tail tape measure protein [Nitrosopumilales archaeon]|nr:MAG: phage tail tape measure protein [Nitrosopumilales archaeon]
MAGDVEKKITIKYSSTGLAELTRQTENYSRSLKTITTTNQTLNTQTGTWQTTSQSIRNTTGTMGGLKGALTSTMMGFIGINAAIGYASEAYQELRKWIDASVVSYRAFEYQIAEVSSILDSTTRDTLPSLEVGLSTLSITYGKSIGDLTKGLYEIVSAAFDVDDAMNLLNVVTKASMAGLTTVEGAVKTFTGVLNAYGQSAAHAAELSDQMFEAVIRGNFTFKDLEGSLGYVVPIAANLGVEFKEVAASLATATRQGQHIDSVTRGLGLLMQGMVDPTKEASEAAKKYGIDMSATALRITGLTGFFKQLHDATQKYGMQILPELIGNMRSLRVAMALTGDEGIQGFTEDMALLETATGKTDAALAAMMNTQKTMSDILTQSMEKVNRSIGEAWSGVDIWWKKAQLWWGTLLSGGDADKAVQGFDSAVEAMRQSYIQNIVQPAASGEKTIFDKLQEMDVPSTVTPAFSKLIKDTMQFGTVKQYLDVTDQAESLNKEATAATNAQLAIKSLLYQAEVAGKELNKKSVSPLRYHYDQNMNKGMQYVDQNTLAVANQALSVLGMNTVDTTMSISELNKVLENVNVRSADLTGSLEGVTKAENELRPAVDQFQSAFEDMSAAIADHQDNIVSLEAELRKLEEQISDTYKGFSGKLTYEVEVKISENKMDQFQEYSNMAAKYGSEYINEWTNVFDQYGNNMSDVLKTIYEYNDALEEQTRAQQEAKNAARELEIQLAENNIQMLKLQLAGMMRRRGNTRAEQREMKMIEIENTKIRIQQMQQQYDEQVANHEETNDATRSAYEEAQQILQAYTDYEKHQLWLLKDTRAEDIADLQQNIQDQKTLYESRTKMLQDEYAQLNSMTTLYTQTLMAVARDPELAAQYKKFFGIDAMEQARIAYEDYITFVSQNPVSGGVGGSGGGVPKVNTYRVKSTNPPPDFVGPILEKSVTSSSGVTKSYNWKTGVGDKSITSLKIGDTIGWTRGTNYIPETGMYQLHKYEKVVPAGGEGGESISNVVTININNPQVNSDQDISKLARTLENVMRANLTDKKYGKSKHRIA